MGMVGARRPAMRPAFCYRIRDRDVLRVSSGSGRTAESRDADRQTGRYGNDSVHRGRCRTKARLRARRHVGPARGLIVIRHDTAVARCGPRRTIR